MWPSLWANLLSQRTQNTSQRSQRSALLRPVCMPTLSYLRSADWKQRLDMRGTGVVDWAHPCSVPASSATLSYQQLRCRKLRVAKEQIAKVRLSCQDFNQSCRACIVWWTSDLAAGKVSSRGRIEGLGPCQRSNSNGTTNFMPCKHDIMSYETVAEESCQHSWAI